MNKYVAAIFSSKFFTVLDRIALAVEILRGPASSLLSNAPAARRARDDMPRVLRHL